MPSRAPDERSEPRADVEGLLAAARAGSEDALGRLLETYRGYLLGIANEELDPNLQGKLGGSDLVQETFLKAHAEFDKFRGRSREEWLSWLRTILRNHLSNVDRRYQRTGKRSVSRERPLGDPSGFTGRLAAEGDSPSSLARARERDEQLGAALEQLPESQRQLIQWRNYEMMSFEEIGHRLGKSAEAARKLWARALQRLQRQLDPPP